MARTEQQAALLNQINQEAGNLYRAANRVQHSARRVKEALEIGGFNLPEVSNGNSEAEYKHHHSALLALLQAGTYLDLHSTDVVTALTVTSNQDLPLHFNATDEEV